MHPATANSNGTVVDLADPELLEPLDAADDIHQRIDRSNLVQRNPIGRQAVDPSFRRAEQLKSLYRPLLHPAGERCLLDDRDQLTDVPVRAVGRDVSLRLLMIRVIMQRVAIVAVLVVCDLGRGLVPAAGQANRYLGRPHPTAVYRSNVDRDVGEAEPSWKRPEPFRG